MINARENRRDSIGYKARRTQK